MKKKYIIYLLGVISFAGIILLGDACIIRKVTGLPCPSCGMTRAFFALFRLDIKSAFNYHPLFWSIPPIFIFVYMHKHIKYYKQICIGIIALFILVYIIRMILFFPHTTPMDYNHNSMIAKIYNIILILKGN